MRRNERIVPSFSDSQDVVGASVRHVIYIYDEFSPNHLVDEDLSLLRQTVLVPMADERWDYVADPEILYTLEQELLEAIDLRIMLKIELDADIIRLHDVVVFAGVRVVHEIK